MNLLYSAREPAPPVSSTGPGVEALGTRPAPPEPEAPQRLHRSPTSREETTTVGPDSLEKDVRQRALAAQLAFRGAIREVSGSTRRISSEFARLNASDRSLVGGNGVFLRYTDYGTARLRWMDVQLAAATRLANAASEVDDPDMQLALLRRPALGSRPPCSAPFCSPSGSTCSTSPTPCAPSTSIAWSGCSRTWGAGSSG
ncbi:hypothetical protein ACN28S_31525 [Cystobacter fuscus]